MLRRKGPERQLDLALPKLTHHVREGPGEHHTKHAGGEDGGQWIVECDWDLATDEFHGKPVVIPMTTINWLLNHFGAAPGLFAELEIVGGPTTSTQEIYGRMWGHTIIPTVDEGTTRQR